MGYSYDDFPTADPLRQALRDHPAATDGLVLICHGFTARLYAQFRCILPDDFVMQHSGEQAGYCTAATVVHVRMVAGAADLPVADSDALTLAAVDPEVVPPNAVYAAGYTDFLSYPFIGTEVPRRLSVVRGELAQRNLDILPGATRQERLLQQACDLLSAEDGFSGGIEVLARRLATKGNTLNRAVKQRYGVGPITWQRQQRLNRAAELLVRTDRSILDVCAADRYGNYTPRMTAYEGQAHDMVLNNSGDVVQFSSANATSPNEVKVRNKLQRGSINACIFRDGRLPATKINMAPGKNAEFEFHPRVYIGVVSQIEEGDIMSSAIISQVNTEINLFGITSADIVMTGGGPGRASTPFEFHLENIDK